MVNSLCVRREVKIEVTHNSNTMSMQRFKDLLMEEVASIPNVGRSIVTPKESGKATRLTGSLSRNSRQFARYSSRVKYLPARSGLVVSRVSRTRLAFTVLISRMAFAIGGTAIPTVVG